MSGVIHGLGRGTTVFIAPDFQRNEPDAFEDLLNLIWADSLLEPFDDEYGWWN